MFLIHGMTGEFWLNHEHCGYYVMRLWILFKSCVVDRFPLSLSSGREPLSYLCQVWVDVVIPQPVSVDTGSGGYFSLLLGGNGGLGFPLGVTETTLAGREKGTLFQLPDKDFPDAALRQWLINVYRWWKAQVFTRSLQMLLSGEW